MIVARLELVRDPDGVTGMRETDEDDKPATSVSTEIQELLWTLVEQTGKHLTTGNRTSCADFCLDFQMCPCVLSHKQIMEELTDCSIPFQQPQNMAYVSKQDEYSGTSIFQTNWGEGCLDNRKYVRSNIHTFIYSNKACTF